MYIIIKLIVKLSHVIQLKIINRIGSSGKMAYLDDMNGM